ncbi:ATP-binding protein [Pantoea sp. MHSD4]|uniref:ATP-binding protein n=1 Tax=Pantoea sp. MHSD4 TaxID=2898077 RepID=UPI000CF3F933|nr:ATP-binding protein [Pantoea sp. MHSD4]MCD2357897.1 ATP-binding protein [Pantoea sp. MHSD4]PQL27292.1 Bipolar DNA helicase [Pantoea ananatis]
MESDNFKIVSVSFDKVSIEILEPSSFEGEFSIGSYVAIPCRSTIKKDAIGIIDNYKIKDMGGGDANSYSITSFILEVSLIGTLTHKTDRKIFLRGGHGIPLPPVNDIRILESDDLNIIFNTGLNKSDKFDFSSLSQNTEIRTPVNGNKFFNKHFAIVGSTGSGKSHTVARIIQSATAVKSTDYSELNNSHIVIFDIHGEYRSAFPNCNYVDEKNIKIPYWLLNDEELSELFIESSENNSHNQVSQFRYAVTKNKELHNPGQKVYFDSPHYFDIREVVTYLKNMTNELISKKDGKKPVANSTLVINERLPCYFNEEFDFVKESSLVNGPFNGEFDRLIIRLENILNNGRLRFLFNDVNYIGLDEILKQFIGYMDKKSNVTVINLSGIPFEVISITVSLITRVLFEFGYYTKRCLQESKVSDVPLLLVYEEAHKYIPRSDLGKYRASKFAIERLAKEGRKYGVTLAIVSQRPSEVSETIFSQCNNFISMRLTNPEDQRTIKKLMPDTAGNMVDNLPILKCGEALLIGDSITLPSRVIIDSCNPEPSSTDIPFYDIWSEQWKLVNFEKIIQTWKPKE